ncbi:hypothetical protein SNEBB_003051 [Seison nebaliae]|nr:hypothetical protein SNEBB_003051 [Seison nebaliae]
MNHVEGRRIDGMNITTTILMIDTIVQGESMQHVQKSVEKIAVAFQSLFLLLGVIGNGFVLILFLKNQKMRTPNHFILANLCLCDLLLSIFCAPAGIMHTLYKSQWFWGRFLCYFVYFIELALVNCAAWFCVAMAIERYFVICRCMEAKNFITKRRIRIVCLMCWMFGMFTAFPLNYFIRNQSSTDDSSSICEVEIQKDYAKLYLTISGVADWLIPNLICIILYTHITKKLFSASKELNYNEEKNQSISLLKRISIGSKSFRERTRLSLNRPTRRSHLSLSQLKNRRQPIVKSSRNEYQVNPVILTQSESTDNVSIRSYTPRRTIWKRSSIHTIQSSNYDNGDVDDNTEIINQEQHSTNLSNDEINRLVKSEENDNHYSIKKVINNYSPINNEEGDYEDDDGEDGDNSKRTNGSLGLLPDAAKNIMSIILTKKKKTNHKSFRTSTISLKINVAKRRQDKQRRQTTYAMLLTMIAFIVCTSPFRIFFIWAIYENNHTKFLSPAQIIIMSCIFRTIFYIHSCINPIIYHVLSDNFRREARRFFMHDCALKSCSPLVSNTKR